MPKIFKPRIGGNLSQKIPKVENNYQPETTAVSIIEPIIHDAEVTVTSRDELKETAESKSASINEIPDENEKVDNVDIDDTVSEISISYQSDHSLPSVLFKRQSNGGNRKRRNMNEFGDLPPIDQPLDRSTVSMRSLLNWIPINKPPPKIRELRIAVGQLETVSHIPEVKNVSPIASPEPVVNTPQMDTSLDLKDSKSAELDPFAPQLCLDADGNLVLDEKSLEIQRPDAMVSETRRHVSEQCGLYSTSYSSFRREFSSRGSHWSEKDTIHFYRALSTIGTDFYCMMKLFPNRSRQQILRKYKREERLFPHLVNDALKNKREYDVTAIYESSDEEKYSDLAREILTARRKTIVKKVRRKSPSERIKKPYRVTQAEEISALIDDVLSGTTDAVVKEKTSTPVVAFLGPAGSMSVGRFAEPPTKNKNKQPLINKMIIHMEKKTVPSVQDMSDLPSIYSQYKEAVIRLSPLNNISHCSDPSDMLDRVLTELNA